MVRHPARLRQALHLQRSGERQRSRRACSRPSRAQQIHQDHGNNDGKKLQADAPAHQRLAEVGAGAAHHVPQARQQHQHDGNHRQRGQIASETFHRFGPICACTRRDRRHSMHAWSLSATPRTSPAHRQLTDATIAVIFYREFRHTFDRRAIRWPLIVFVLELIEGGLAKDVAHTLRTLAAGCIVAACTSPCRCSLRRRAPWRPTRRASGWRATAAGWRRPSAAPRSCRRTSTRSPPSASASTRGWSRRQSSSSRARRS